MVAEIREEISVLVQTRLQPSQVRFRHLVIGGHISDVVHSFEGYKVAGLALLSSVIGIKTLDGCLVA